MGPKRPFLLRYASRDTRCIDFRGLTGSQRTPRVLGRHNQDEPEEEKLTKSS